MILAEQAALRALLAPLYDSTRALKLPSGIRDDMVLALARHHRLSPALSTVILTETSAFLADTFHADRLVTLGRATLLRQTLIEVTDALGQAGIETVVLKGMAYEALVYPVPGTRPATDIDLLVRLSARKYAFEVFRKLDFEPIGGAPGFDEPSYHEVTLRRGDSYVDLHFGLAPFVRGAIDYDELWSATQSWPSAGIQAALLSRPHAALHQALHMAVNHFDVPALYLLDLARLAIDRAVAEEAEGSARKWRCLHAWQTAAALATFFIPGARPQFNPRGERAVGRTARVLGSFGGLAGLPRPEQLRRKIEHFDNPVDAVRYLFVQGRRILRENLIARSRLPPSPSRRLNW